MPDPLEAVGEPVLVPILTRVPAVPVRRTTDFTEVIARVTKPEGFLFHRVFYSAPSQLIGQRLRVHIHEDRIEAYLGATRVVTYSQSWGQSDERR